MDTEIQGCKDPRIQGQGFKDTRTKGFKDSRIRGFRDKDSRIHGLKDSRIQGFKESKDSRIQGFKDSGQGSKDSRIPGYRNSCWGHLGVVWGGGACARVCGEGGGGSGLGGRVGRSPCALLRDVYNTEGVLGAVQSLVETTLVRP